MSIKKPTESFEVVHVRLPRALVKTIDHLAVERDWFRQDAMVVLLEAGLQSLGFTWPPPDKPTNIFATTIYKDTKGRTFTAPVEVAGDGQGTGR